MRTNAVTYHGISFDIMALETFCLENGINKLSLFGSVLRDDFGSESDVDMLVEFMPGEKVGFMRLMEIESALSRALKRKKIDLRTLEDISEYFRDRVLEEAETLYVR